MNKAQYQVKDTTNYKANTTPSNSFQQLTELNYIHESGMDAVTTGTDHVTSVNSPDLLASHSRNDLSQ